MGYMTTHLARAVLFHSRTQEYLDAAVLLDEVAFWRSDESANPDKEILAALRMIFVPKG
jgi:hypothetical protein